MCVCVCARGGKEIHVLMKTLLSCNLLDALRGIFYYCNDLFFTHPLFVVAVYYYYCRVLSRLDHKTGVTSTRGNTRPCESTVTLLREPAAAHSECIYGIPVRVFTQLYYLRYTQSQR